ncbi:5-bromo-4-chloroindolyl phosphate hydrolysis protein [Gracilibacillus boraciitolerans JCM 21714]|uniref:5-bromo-4-chloroindolyl phosphate hydrolysis protein n=1 Tax=Gracilibacillus boraciitolerans JCM 21714 TaxID=1298598 RepID=W4VKF7_9BACI|nr:5-bromo-4-chloroindolyl phosphate hydrolysis family protein [Gracilibacillus boraciitolerans]GAE93254.1 5-bromo-4-chloroindolyl phosphate hydrolysis protein [Gracilibacillus boraciitolerans JCM 21714]
MYKFLSIVTGIIITIPVMSTIWLVSFFAIDLTFLLSSLISLIGAGLTYSLISVSIYVRFLKKHQLSMKDYRYIRKNLAEANHKIRRLQKALFSIRHLLFLKENMELLRVIKKIHRVTKKKPMRFFQGGERFYFSHLDSAVELTEKYAFFPLSLRKMKKWNKCFIRHVIP